MSAILKMCSEVFACYETIILRACQTYQKLMTFSVTEATDQSVPFTKLLKSLRNLEYKTLETKK